MSDAVIVGLISATCTIIVQLIVFYSKTKETNANIARHEQKQQDMLDDVNRQLDEVKKRLDTHNRYAEKFGEIEQSMICIKKDIEYLRKENL